MLIGILRHEKLYCGNGCRNGYGHCDVMDNAMTGLLPHERPEYLAFWEFLRLNDTNGRNRMNEQSDTLGASVS